MNRLRIISLITFLILLVFSCERRLCGCDPAPESPLNGDWHLATITYGLTQKTVTAAEAGYTETLSFRSYSDVKGTYRQVRNGIPGKTVDYSVSFPKQDTSNGLISFPADTTEQSFRIVDNKLYLSERIPQGVTLADGSTYQYQR